MHSETHIISRALMLGYGALALFVFCLVFWGLGPRFSTALIVHGQLVSSQVPIAIQHATGGTLTTLHVSEGDQVTKGEALLSLDSATLRASRASLLAQTYELQSRQSRLEAERDGLPQMALHRDDAPSELRALWLGQMRLFQSRMTSHEQARQQIDHQIAQANAQIDARKTQQLSLQTQAELLGMQISSATKLREGGFGTQDRLIDMKREEARLQGAIDEIDAQLAQLQSQISALRLSKAERQQLRQEQAITELRSLEYRLVELSAKLTDLDRQIEATTITAPISGRVFGLSTYAQNSVVSPNEAIFHIVPTAHQFEALAMVPSDQIGQAYLGQSAKIIAQNGVADLDPIKAKVRQISADIISERQSGARYYQLELALESDMQDNWPARFHQNMSITAYLETDSIRFGAYVTEPLMRYFSRAMR